MTRLFFFMAALLLLGNEAAAETLKLATWNMEWLSSRREEMPREVEPKSESTVRALRGYADRLAADVIGFQEVDGMENAQRVFDPSKYELVVADENDVQRVGFAIRKGLLFKRNPDLAALDLYPTGSHSLRRGVDITLTQQGQQIRMLVVHLKSGCFAGDLEPDRKACAALARQIPILRSWMGQREAEGVPYIILGDFNRRFDPQGGVPDPVWQELSGAGQVYRATEGHVSRCGGGMHQFIDHILVSHQARKLLVLDSFEQIVYSQPLFPWSRDQAPSDHCPVSIRLQNSPKN